MNSAQVEGKRSTMKHLEILKCIGVLESAINEAWELLYKINPGMASPKESASLTEVERTISLSEAFMIIPERLRNATQSLRSCIEQMEGELY